MASTEMTLPVPPDVARQVADQQDRPKSAIAAISSQQGAMDPATAQNLQSNMQQLEKVVGDIYQQVQGVAPQLLPLLEPMAQAGKALKSELAAMMGGKGGASQTPGAAPGVTTPEMNEASPGSVVSAG